MSKQLWRVIGTTKRSKSGDTRYKHTVREANIIIKYNQELIDKALKTARVETLKEYTQNKCSILWFENQIQILNAIKYKPNAKRQTTEEQHKLRELKDLRLYRIKLIATILNIVYKK